MLLFGDNLLPHEALLRFGCFLTLLGLFVALESRSPRRPRRHPRRWRWAINFSLALFAVLLLRIIVPLVATPWAAHVGQQHWGLLHQLGLSPAFHIAASVVLLDVVIYWQHRLFHTVPLLWRLHRVHHSDPDLDVSTALRFYPLEICLSLGIKLGAITVLGLSPWGYLLFEIILNGSALFNHSNWYIPENVERRLRRWWVTPDMHRIHHSSEPRETNSNFGTNLSCWDRLFGSYCPQPARGQGKMELGLKGFSQKKHLDLGALLLMPFQGQRK